jgi:hypothetical protein
MGKVILEREIVSEEKDKSRERATKVGGEKLRK